MNILIIEDDLAIRNTLEDLLEFHGHAVWLAANGRDGLKLAEQRPDLIFCDIAMPGMGGYEVIAAIHRLPHCRDIPFIFLTARATRDDQRHGMTLGADDYITKPFSEQDIIDAVAAAIRRQRPLRERIERLLEERQRLFAADWTHEVMTPLNEVLVGLDMIRAEADTLAPGELKKLLELVRIGAERQHALSQKLVLYHQLERQKTMVPREAGRCDDAGASISTAADRVARRRNRFGDLHVDCAPGPVPVAPALLGAAVAELVDNALGFSLPGQPVQVTGARRAGRYRIRVADQGAGMEAAQRQQVGAYRQFGEKGNMPRGLGLGLAIVQAVADLAGGQLILQDNASGRGLEAIMDFPEG